MLDKQILKVDQPYNDSIVKMADSPSVYIDDRFYKDVMGEDKSDKSNKSYPVSVVAMRIDYILNLPEGRLFLKAIHESDNLELYEETSLQMLIEYLFQKQKVIVMYVLCPAHVLRFIVFEYIVALNEAGASRPAFWGKTSGPTQAGQPAASLVAGAPYSDVSKVLALAVNYILIAIQLLYNLL